MADNILTKDRTDADIALAAKDSAGVLVPRNLIVDTSGADITPLTDAQLRASAVTVSAASLPLPTGAATQTTLAAIEAKLPALVNNALRMAGYDPGDDMMKVKSVQKKWRDSFVGASINTAKWDTATGTGGAITVSGGQLTLGSGTTINADTYVLSKETFTIPFRVNIGMTLSQRIANQTFAVEAISVDPSTLIPDGLHTVGLLFDGTTATQAKYRVQNSGAAALDSAASTFPTTASGGFYELEPFADEAWFHGGTLDANTGRANSYRRHQQIPEPNAVFKIRLRWLNGGSAPASNTNAVIQYISVQDYAELTAEITAGRGQTVAGQAMGVAVVSMPTTTVSGTVTANQGTFTAPTPSNISSAASTNATSIKTSAGTVYSITASNTGAAAAFVKLYNKASAPTVGTDVPVLTIPIPASGIVNIPFGTTGHRFATGIALAITNLAADSDATAVAAAQVKVLTSYI